MTETGITYMEAQLYPLIHHFDRRNQYVQTKYMCLAANEALMQRVLNARSWKIIYNIAIRKVSQL
ncbi:MAG: hypothetical protein LBH04_10025 [Tannerellaceae bacterium]|jgi:hypothetical protein|nr:hypothetical protein [Tannerellaceae bacterium]